MRVLVWLLRAFVFFALFAFALNNQQAVTVNLFFGAQWQARMVIVVLVAFGAGCAFGVMAMLPSWWRHRRSARRDALGNVATDTGERSAPAMGSAAGPASGFSGDQPPRVGL